MSHHLYWALPLLAAMGCGKGDVDSAPLPDVPDQQGVVYVSGHPAELHWYDLTGEHPVAAGSMEFTNGISDMAVDSINHRMALAIDSRVVLLSLDTPDGGLDAPTEVGEISFPDEWPEEVLLDPYHHRLYVQTSGHGVFHGDDSYEDFPAIHIVDISSLESPEVVGSFEPTGWPKLAIDPIRRILFTIIGESTLEMYDVGADTLKPMAGSPIDLTDDYPGEGGHIFQAYSPRTDPWSARFYAERQQSELSEVIAYQYDEFVPKKGATYSDGASMKSMRTLPTALDNGTTFRERHAPLFSGPTPLPDPRTGGLMVMVSTEEAVGVGWGVMHLNDKLRAGGECTDEAGPICTLRNWSDGEPLAPLLSNGTACIDTDRRVVAATTSSEYDNGTMQFFRYTKGGNLTAWLGEEGSPLPTVRTPYDAVCH